jgi:hypothetical protein
MTIPPLSPPEDTLGEEALGDDAEPVVANPRTGPVRR